MDLSYGKSIYNHHHAFFTKKSKYPDPNFWKSIRIDAKLRRSIIIATVLILVYKCYTSSSNSNNKFSLNPETSERLWQIKRYTETEVLNAWNYLSQPETVSFLTSFLCGIVFSLFSWIIVHFDSETTGFHLPTGFHPPTGASPNSKFRFRHQKKSTMHIGYIAAIASGFVVTSLMLFG